MVWGIGDMNIIMAVKRMVGESHSRIIESEKVYFMFQCNVCGVMF